MSSENTDDTGDLTDWLAKLPPENTIAGRVVRFMIGAFLAGSQTFVAWWIVDGALDIFMTHIHLPVWWTAIGCIGLLGGLGSAFFGDRGVIFVAPGVWRRRH